MGDINLGCVSLLYRLDSVLNYSFAFVFLAANLGPSDCGLKFTHTPIITGTSDTGGDRDASDAPLLHPDLPQSGGALPHLG